MSEYVTTKTVTSDICPITGEECLHTRETDQNVIVGEGPFCAGHLYPNVGYRAPRVLTSPRCEVIDDLAEAIVNGGQCSHRLITKADVNNSKVKAWAGGLDGVPEVKLFTIKQGKLTINDCVVNDAIKNLRRRKKI